MDGLDDYISLIDWENDEWPSEVTCSSCFYGLHDCDDLLNTEFGLEACACTNPIHN